MYRTRLFSSFSPRAFLAAPADLAGQVGTYQALRLCMFAHVFTCPPWFLIDRFENSTFLRVQNTVFNLQALPGLFFIERFHAISALQRIQYRMTPAGGNPNIRTPKSHGSTRVSARLKPLRVQSSPRTLPRPRRCTLRTWARRLPEPKSQSDPSNL